MTSDVTARITETVESLADHLIEVSHQIWDHPELCFAEHFAHDLLTASLESAGLDVERGAFGLDTAFRATAGAPGDGPTIAICCEYDALPSIGHACGHNVIAAAGLGAALAAAPLATELGGRLVVLGTPAEEGGGGKVHMINAGALDDIDAAMMVHPADQDLDSFHAIAIHEARCAYHGVAAHAAAAPHLGVNALDAAVIGYQAVGALRQHIESHERVHGVFSHGGDKPNVVPAFAETHWYVRSGTTESLARLKPRVEAALQAGALATGATAVVTWADTPYEELTDNDVLLQLYRRHAAARGRTIESKAERPEFIGSTDMGNISNRVPSLHPMVAVAPRGVAIHTPAFAEAARSADADRAIIDSAIAMACTTVDLWQHPELLSAARGVG